MQTEIPSSGNILGESPKSQNDDIFLKSDPSFHQPKIKETVYEILYSTLNYPIARIRAQKSA